MNRIFQRQVIVGNLSNSVIRHFSKERAGKSVKPGAAIVLDGVPHRVTKIIQGKRGKGGGFVRATLKNIVGCNSFEKTFTSDELVEHADMEKKAFQYSWNDGDNYNFMDCATFEEVTLNKDIVDCHNYLQEGQEVKLQMFNSKVIGVEIPLICTYKVVRIDENKSTSSNKVAVIDSGANVVVPAFVEEGDMIRVNTAEDLYIDRVNK